MSQEQQIIELDYLAKHLKDEHRLRGTAQIFLNKDESLKPVNGELLRLICFNNTFDTIHINYNSFHAGWVINQSSPTYKGNTNKWFLGQNRPEVGTTKVTDLDQYELINPSAITITNEKLTIATSTTATGIGSNTLDLDKAFKVNPNLSYLISLTIKVDHIDTKINFGLDCYQPNGTSESVYDADQNTVSNTFLINKTFNSQTLEYQVQGIIYAHDKTFDLPLEDKSLKFTSKVNYISPYLTAEGTTGTVELSNYSIKPLNTDYNLAFINSNKFVEIWLTNNNPNLNTKEIKELIEQYLLPHDVKLIYHEIEAFDQINLPNVSNLSDVSGWQLIVGEVTNVGDDGEDSISPENMGFWLEDNETPWLL